ncbi:hypothetical protein ABZP36_019400 [Zizania latifolia]
MQEMPLSATSVYHASYLVVILLAATAGVSATSGGDGNAVASNATAMTGGSGDTEMYICYLCTGRNPMMIRYCPIYWDYCHLVCYDASATSAAAVAPVAPAAPAPAAAAGVPRESIVDEECYVMKLYENGSYVIVTRLGCSRTATCQLSCGGGDAAIEREELLQALDAASPVTPTAPQGVLPVPPPRVADFERCGTQPVRTARTPSAVPGGGV